MQPYLDGMFDQRIETGYIIHTVQYVKKYASVGLKGGGTIGSVIEYLDTGFDYKPHQNVQVLKDWSHPQASSDFLNIYVQYLEREEEKIISYLEYFAVVLAEGVTH